MKQTERLLEILGEIDDRYIEEAAEKPKNARSLVIWRRIRMGAAGLCAALVLSAGLAVYYQLSDAYDKCMVESSTGISSSETESSDFQIPSPFQECDTMEQAAALTGFSMAVPETYGTYTHTVIQAVEQDMIEVIYQDDNGEEGIRIRKANGTEEISGDYNEYDSDQMVELHEMQVRLRGNGGMVSVAEWTDGTYSYAIDLVEGVEQEVIAELMTQIQ